MSASNKHTDSTEPTRGTSSNRIIGNTEATVDVINEKPRTYASDGPLILVGKSDLVYTKTTKLSWL